MKYLLLAIVSFSILASSCATTYQPLSEMGGYRDLELSQENYNVSFYGNGYTSSDTAYLFFLTRAAEIALERGFEYFYLNNLQNLMTHEVYTTPGTLSTQLTQNYFGTITATSTYAPGIMYNINKPGFTGNIVFVHEPLKDAPPPLDARLIYAQGMDMKKRVDSNNKTATETTLILSVVFGAVTILVLSAQ